jgi:putative transposase
MERRAYTSDLTDEQWELLEPFMPPILKWCRPRIHSYREILNGIFYKLRNGCAWQNLPHDLPPWPTVHDYYRKWRIEGRWRKIHDALVARERRREGREETPSAGVIDSQSVETTETGTVKKGAGASRRSVMTPASR